jgi:cytochrome c
MKTLLLAATLTAISTWVMAASVEEELAKSKSCLGCHAMNKKVMGPALLDLAKKYGSQPDAEAMLVQKVLTGSKGVWGSVAMPPNPISEADATTLVKWILGQK